MKLFVKIEEEEIKELTVDLLKKKGLVVKKDALRVVYETEGDYDDVRPVGFHIEVELEK